MQVIASKGFHLSPLQAHLWSLQNKSDAYRLVYAAHIEGPLDESALEKVLQQVIERHEILRTVFRFLPNSDIPVQVIVDITDWSLPLICLEHLDEAFQHVEIEKLISSLQQKHFYLEQGPLFYNWLLHVSADTHILLICLPALCADYSTCELIVREIQQRYVVDSINENDIESPLQYADVAAWQEEMLLDEEAESRKQYWRKLDLSSFASMRLPFEREKRALQKDTIPFEYQLISLSLEDVLMKGISERCTEYTISVEEFLLTCWSVLLGRLTSEYGLVIGVACNGRVYEELSDALGPYTRFVPLIVQFEPSSYLPEVLNTTASLLHQARQWQLYCPWPSMSSSDGPFAQGFPMLFEYTREPAAFPNSPWKLSPLYRYSCTEPFILKLSVYQSNARLHVIFSYDSSRLSHLEMQRLVASWHWLLEQMVQQPLAPVRSFALLRESEQRELQASLRGPLLSPTPLCLHQLFEEQVRRWPQRLALLSEQQSFCYQAANEAANQLAHWLRRQGVGPNVLVGLYLPRSAQALIAVLAILKAGGAYLALDAESPPARVLKQAQHTSLFLLLTHTSLHTRLMDWPGPVQCVDDLEGLLSKEDCTNPPSCNVVDDLAYLITTSGSTGTPKGVMISHRSAVNYSQGLCAALPFKAGWSFATVSSLAADLGNTAIFGAWATGGCVQILDYETVTSAEAFAHWAQRHPIDVLKIVPSHLTALLAETDELGTALLPRHILLLGGEMLPEQLIERLRHLRSTCRVYNHYGPTETTVGVLVHEIKQTEKTILQGRIPIGRPLANAAMYVLDPQQHMVPLGERGELYIGGPGLALGYWQQATQTAERFVPDRFASNGGRLYQTGDMVRVNESGEIEFEGREDRQVKLRGYRVDLGEIEAVLMGHPNVRMGAVVQHEDEKGTLVGYVIAKKQPEATSQQLREYLHTFLPEYMLPRLFVSCKSFPLTSNGKLDRRRLPRPEQNQSDSRATPSLARNPIEEILLGIWKEILGISSLGIHDNFFHLGGHSLLVTRVISRIRATLGIELSILSLFAAPTIAELGQQVTHMLQSMQGLQLPQLHPVEKRMAHMPLSFAQQRLWLLDQLEPMSTAYITIRAQRLKGGLSVQALHVSLYGMVQRHEILRTTFQMHDGQPAQIIHPACMIALPLIDLQGLAHQERVHEAQRLSRLDALRHFHLEHGSLLRVSLFRFTPEEHILLMEMHHIITDAWSDMVFQRELSILYLSFIKNLPSPLAPLSIQYADFAFWQRQWLQGAVLEAQLAYWRQQLQGISPLELPCDYSRPSVQTYQGAFHSTQLPSLLVEKLLALSQRENVTLFMLLLAAFQVLLARYSGQSDISVGTPIANRTHKELEGLIGFFVNTLVLRVNLSDNPSFLALLARVRDVALGAYTHQDLPFEYLVEELQPARDLSRSPLFQVMFSVQQNVDRAEVQMPLRSENVNIGNTPTKFDLELNIVEMEKGLRCVFIYNIDLFQGHTIDQLSDNFQELLEGIVSHPEWPLARLSLLNPAEKHLLLVEWAATQRPYSLEKPFPILFTEQAAYTPDSIALSYNETCITYGELERRSNRLAHHLQWSGVGTETLVGVYMERSLEMAIVLLGIFKAGGAYVPLDPAYPQQRLALILHDAHVSCVVTQSSLKAALSDSAYTVLCVEAILQTSEHGDEPVSVFPAMGQLAYVIYTSGSTGQPKGAMVTHHGMLNHLFAKIETLHLSRGDILAQTASHCFDISVWQFFAALLVGGQAHIFMDEMVYDTQQFLIGLKEAAISTLEVVPSLLRSLLETTQPSLTEATVLEGLRWMVVTGEPLSPELGLRWFNTYPHTPLLNAYGPTECSDDVTHALLDRMSLEGQRSTPIGRAVTNTRIYLVDQALELVPLGVPGEIYVGGIGVGRGYLGDVIRTATSFVPDPFGVESGARLYKTGDRGRYRSDGQIEFLGRIDQQVKVHGYRIELGEIEAVLESHADVREVVVSVQEEIQGTPQLIAYIVLNAVTRPPSSHVLQSYLRERLPHYMVPTFLIRLETLPLMENGKVDRRALQVLPLQVNEKEQEKVAQTMPTPIEELLLGIWREVLGSKQIHIQDNFFALGGHSLLATQVMARVRTLVKRDVPLRALFEAPTIAELALYITHVLHAVEPDVEAPMLLPMLRPTELPLSFSQQRLWFLDQLEPHNSAYLIANAWRLSGCLDVVALERVLQEVLIRHESLRTTFQWRNNQPVQVIHEADQFFLPVIDFRNLSQEQRIIQVGQVAKQEGLQPCDLAQGPLLRAWLLCLTAEEYVLLLTVHHIVSDGWSMLVLQNELNILYRAFTARQPSPLPPLPIQYADFALWQRQWLHGPVLEKQLAYWREQLAGAPALALPTDHPRPLRQSYRGALHTIALPFSLYEQLMTLSQHEGVTLFMLLLAAFLVLLSRSSGQSDISVGTPIANRTRAEVEGLIGFFINTLVLRVDMSDNPCFVELLARVREVALGAYMHQDVPFEQLVDMLHPQRDLNRSPLFQVMFGVQQLEDEAEKHEGLTIDALETEHLTTKFDMTFNVVSSSQHWSCEIEYSTDLFEAASIHRLLDHWHTLLQAIVADPTTRLSDLSLLSVAEQQALLQHASSPMPLEPQPQPCFPALFEQHARLHPDAIALVSQTQALSYQHLNRRANQLAHYLRQVGVGPERLVGVLVERSVPWLISLLAILKAGGTYVPLEAHSSPERLAWMLEDLQAFLVLGLSAQPASWPQTSCPLLLLPDLWHHVELYEQENLALSPALESLAYVIYTSGSTGHPKGVMVLHQGLSCLAQAQQQAFALHPAERVLQLASLSFDACIWEIVMAWQAGATLHIAAQDSLLPGPALITLLQDQAITSVTLPPSVLAAWPQAELTALHTIISAGEACPARLVEQWAGGRRFVNAYGPTEITVCASLQGCPEDGEPPAIGHAFGPTRLFVLDETLHLQPWGVAGELYIGGQGVARGYWGHPDWTAERFLPDPYSGQAGARFYKTGDRVRWQSDGSLQYVGRMDQQVKIRGYRVELGEVEAVIAGHAGVEMCVVVMQGQAEEARMVAYVVGKGDQALPQRQEWYDYLRPRLPEYMHPWRVVQREEVPRLSNGKVNRRALEQQEEEEPASHPPTGGEPRTPTEERLQEIWGEVLGDEEIAVTDNFFALGGHSLLATQIMARVQERLGIEVPLQTFFEAPTIAQLAIVIEQEKAAMLGQVENEELARMVSLLENLSEDEMKNTNTSKM